MTDDGLDLWDGGERRDVLRRIKGEGVEVAYETAKSIAQDPKANGTARVAATRVLALLSESAARRDAELDRKPLDEMSFEDAQALMLALRRRIRKAETIELEPIVSDIFD